MKVTFRCERHDEDAVVAALQILLEPRSCVQVEQSTLPGKEGAGPVRAGDEDNESEED